MKSGYYHHAIGDLRKRLTAAVPNEVLKALHRKSPARHFAVALRQLVLFAGAFALGWQFDSLWVRVPCALVLGFVVFDGTVLLHEVVHKAVFDGDRPRRVPRARPPLRAPVRDLARAVHALAPRSPRRARLDDGRPEARASLAEEERPLAQAPLRDAGALPDLLPRRAAGDRDVPRDAPAAHPGRAPRRDRPPRRRRPRRSRASAARPASSGSTSFRSSSSSRPRSP